MFVKQVDLQEALKLAAKGKEIKVLVPNGQDGAWEGMFPTTIGKMLDGCLFFRAEPTMKNPEFEAAVQGMEGQNPPPQR